MFGLVDKIMPQLATYGFVSAKIRLNHYNSKIPFIFFLVIVYVNRLLASWSVLTY